MDPDACLAEIREIADRFTTGDPSKAPEEALDHAVRLAELVQALDEWITRGGFPPSSWTRPRDD